MKNLSDILIWKQNLGLLPIHLNPESNNSDYVMLNGGYGDFCLQTINGESDAEDYYSKSWSSNTKNFLVLENENLSIYNWLNDKPEIVPQKLITDNFNKFYEYLLSKSYKSSKDVVPHIIDIFRQFRNLTIEKTNPVEALNLLFVLLTSLEDDISNFDTNKWNLNQVNIPPGFDYYIEQIRKGTSNIKPEFDLIIRHSAGALFQEAQKEVLFFNPQMELFGGVSNELRTKNNLYSSIHYTPPYLSRTIVENSLRHLNLGLDKLKIFDPACGSSEFLIEALKQLKELDYKGNIEIVGWDSSETAINTSNFLLQYEKRTIWKERLVFNIRLVEDSLTEEWENNYNLILMNPPFVSWELLNNRVTKEAVRETLGSAFIGKPNQASAFFYKSIRHLAENGTIGCVIPSSLLTLDSYKKLREEANELMSIKLLGKLGNFVFEDALTDVSLIIGQKPKINSTPVMLWTKNEKGIAQNALRDLRRMNYSNELTIDKSDYSIYQPVTFPILKENWKPISLDNNNLYKSIERFVLENKLARTEDVFSVKQGIRTGNNNLFIISKSEFENLSEDEKKYFRPSIDNENIKNGKLNISKYVWYPYDNDGIIIQSEESFSNNAPIFYSKIIDQKLVLSNRARKDVSNWWHLSEHRAWLRKMTPRLISSEFGKSDSFAFDKEGVFVVERGNAWVPKKEFNQNDYYFYLALFSSSFFNKLLSIYSKQLLSGWDLGKKHTKDIPIPNIHLEEVRSSFAYNKLVEIGIELSEGNNYVKSMSDEILIKYFYPNS